MGKTARHWDQVFASKVDDGLSWFEAEPTTSLSLLQHWSPEKASLIDVGAGRSHLVDRLLEAGWSDLTLLDVSEVALGGTRERLGVPGATVSFVREDVRTWRPSRIFSTWHDRAVFHFLVEPEERDRYVTTAAHALSPGGVLVVAAFAADGPIQCSGLRTACYDPEDLARIFARHFSLEHAEREEHKTPFTSIQPFTWAVLRRR